MPIVLNGNGTVTGLSQLPDSAMAAGSILQVKQTFKTDFFQPQVVLLLILQECHLKLHLHLQVVKFLLKYL